MKRREFLENFALGAGGLVLSQLPFANVLAVEAGKNNVLVTVFLRGGWDAINVLPPTTPGGDKTAYNAMRPSVKVSGNAVTELSGNVHFGMNKALGQHMHSLWDEGKLALLPRVTSLNNTRSHFVQQDLVESGSKDIVQSVGYVGQIKNSGLMSGNLSDLSYVAFGTRQPHVFRGGMPLVMEDIHTFGTLNRKEVTSEEDSSKKLKRFAAGNPTCEKVAGDRAVEYGLCKSAHTSKRLLTSVNAISGNVVDAGSGNFTNDAFGKSFFQAAQMINLVPTLSFINIDQGGYDTHHDQGVGVEGSLAENLDSLGKNLKAFTAMLKANGDFARVTIVVMSEFGRTTKENSNMGTDHGRGGLAMVLGGAVKGKAGLTEPSRRSWNFNAGEQAVGDTSAALNKGMESSALGLLKQLDIRHVMARVLTHVTKESYASIKNNIFGGSDGDLPTLGDDSLKLF